MPASALRLEHPAAAPVLEPLHRRENAQIVLLAGDIARHGKVIGAQRGLGLRFAAVLLHQDQGAGPDLRVLGHRRMLAEIVRPRHATNVYGAPTAPAARKLRWS